MITIHNFARGARGQRVMWQCEEMALSYRVQNHPFPLDPEYLGLNPLGTVPFLEDVEGVAINESVAMMLYVSQTYGPTPLLPLGNRAAVAQIFQLTVFGETELGMNLNVLLTAHFTAPQADKRNWSVQRLEARIERALRHAAALLRGKSFLVGTDLTLADISVCCALGIWKGALGGQLAPELEDYRSRLLERPAYVRAKERCAAGDS